MLRTVFFPLFVLLGACDDRCVEVGWAYEHEVGDRTLCAMIQKPIRFAYRDGERVAVEWTRITSREVAPLATIDHCEAQGNDEPGWVATLWLARASDSMPAPCYVDGGAEPHGEAEGSTLFTFLREGITKVEVTLTDVP